MSWATCENRYHDDKVFDACGLFGFIDTSGRRHDGAAIATAMPFDRHTRLASPTGATPFCSIETDRRAATTASPIAISAGIRTATVARATARRLHACRADAEEIGSDMPRSVPTRARFVNPSPGSERLTGGAYLRLRTRWIG